MTACATPRAARARRADPLTSPPPPTQKHTHNLTRSWETGSYGYHGDDGMRYAASGKGEEYGPRFGAGDTVGACLHLGRQEIFFT